MFRGDKEKVDDSLGERSDGVPHVRVDGDVGVADHDQDHIREDDPRDANTYQTDEYVVR